MESTRTRWNCASIQQFLDSCFYRIIDIYSVNKHLLNLIIFKVTSRFYKYKNKYGIILAIKNSQI